MIRSRDRTSANVVEEHQESVGENCEISFRHKVIGLENTVPIGCWTSSSEANDMGDIVST